MRACAARVASRELLDVFDRKESNRAISLRRSDHPLGALVDSTRVFPEDDLEAKLL